MTPTPSRWERTHSGVPIALWPDGNGVPLIFCHGHVGDHATLGPAYAPWIGQVPIAAIDLPWHGDAPRPESLDITTNARAILDALETLGWSRCRAVAHSAACADLLRAATAEPFRFDALLLIAPTADVDDTLRAEFMGFASLLRDRGFDETVVDLALARWFSDAYRAANPDTRARLAVELRRQDAGAVANALEAFARSPSLIPAPFDLGAAGVRVEALMMDQDTAAPEAHASKVLDAYGARRSRLPGGHRPFDEVPEAFQQELARFIVRPR